jgi:hypothetical protein
MVFSNSTVVEYRNDSSNFTFSFVVSVTVQPSQAGRSFTVDGAAYTTAQTFAWTPGASHTIAATSPQSDGTGVQYVWDSWSDGGAISHTVTPNANTTYTANFTTQYDLTVNADAGGAVSPGSGWNNSGARVNLSVTASNGYSFNGWTGSGSGSYSGTDNPASVTMNGPITEAAGFARIPGKFTAVSVNGNTSVTLACATIPGAPYHLEAATNLLPAVWSPVTGSATNATGTTVTFTPTNPPGGGQGYYRIASP